MEPDPRIIATCTCIRNGRMEDGQTFCIEGKEYEYELRKDDDEDDCIIKMKSENDTGYYHSMDWPFFYKYFTRKFDDFIEAKEMQL